MADPILRQLEEWLEPGRESAHPGLGWNEGDCPGDHHSRLRRCSRHGSTAPGSADVKLKDGTTHDVWWWADTRPVAKLTLGRGIPVLLVLEGASGRNLAFGPVHDPASVLPGQWGNSVIEGHRDTHFRVLKDLRLGDQVHIELPDGRRASFAVAHLQVVDSRRSRIVLDSEAPRLTLVTCYPFDAVRPGGPLRYVVTADWVAPTAPGLDGSPGDTPAERNSGPIEPM